MQGKTDALVSRRPMRNMTARARGILESMQPGVWYCLGAHFEGVAKLPGYGWAESRILRFLEDRGEVESQPVFPGYITQKYRRTAPEPEPNPQP